MDFEFLPLDTKSGSSSSDFVDVTDLQLDTHGNVYMILMILYLCLERTGYF